MTSTDAPPTLAAFNEAAVPTADAVLRPCLDVDRWVAAVLAARPYASLAELLDTAAHAADPLTPAEVEAALAHHPRIGERPTASGAEASLSRSEQAGLDTGGDVAARLAEGNRRYEERFGRVFLIRAAGRSSEEILDQLRERLGSDPDDELVVVGEQLREIGLRRLQGRIQP